MDFFCGIWKYPPFFKTLYTKIYVMFNIRYILFTFVGFFLLMVVCVFDLSTGTGGGCWNSFAWNDRVFNLWRPGSTCDLSFNVLFFVGSLSHRPSLVMAHTYNKTSVTAFSTTGHQCVFLPLWDVCMSPSKMMNVSTKKYQNYFVLLNKFFGLIERISWTSLKWDSLSVCTGHIRY